jgi:hypothetical protein
MADYLALWLIGAALVAIVARQKGFPVGAWFVYGLLLWPVALLHAFARPRSAEGAARAATAEGRLPCPACAEPILPAARLCPQCRSPLQTGWAAAVRAGNLAADGYPADAPPRRFGETVAAYRARLAAAGFIAEQP